MIMIRSLAIVTACLFLVTGSASAEDTQPPPGLLLEEVLDQVSQGIQDAENQLDKDGSLPPLKTVELELETATTKKAGGGFNIWIISIGAKYEKETASKLKVTLSPKPTTADVSANKVADAISKMIIEAANGTYKIGGSPNPMEVSQVVAELKFVVKRESSGGIQFTIAPVTAELSGGLAGRAVQTIKVTFEKKS